MFQPRSTRKPCRSRSPARQAPARVGRPGRFQQVLLNLLSNAIKFAPDEGSIAIRSADAGNDKLKIEIADTGVGIETDLIPRLFTPFEQGEQTITRQFGGLGLGLSIVKSLIDLHQGTITASSRGKDQGATFTLTMSTASPLVQKAAVTGQSADARKRYQILLVEDHADTRQIMTLLLRSFGCIVSVARTMKEAIDIADKRVFDLLISDIGLPDGTGLDVMRTVKARQSDLKAIAISGFGQDEDLRRSREAGFAMHLTKPISLKALQEAIGKIVD